MPTPSTEPNTSTISKPLTPSHPDSELDIEPDLSDFFPTHHPNPHFDDPHTPNLPAMQQSAPMIGIGSESRNFRDLSKPTYFAEDLPLSNFVKGTASRKNGKKRKNLVDEANIDGSENKDLQRMHKKLKQLLLLKISQRWRLS